MIKCPFCHYENEDGALFCERCTSDLSGVAPTPKASAPPPMAEAYPMAEAEPVEALPMAEAEPVEAYPMAEAEPMAMAEPMPLTPALEIIEPMPAPAAPPPPAVEPIKLAPPPAPPAPPPAPAPVAVAPPAPPAPSPATPAPPPAPAAATPATASAADMPPAVSLPPGSQPKLVVLRGQKRNQEYPIYEGLNFIGRADDKPVDIDLEDQEPPDRVWCSRQHACIAYENDQLLIEDLNSANGTYVNRTRVYPGQKRPLAINDVVQIGNVQLKVQV